MPENGLLAGCALSPMGASGATIGWSGAANECAAAGGTAPLAGVSHGLLTALRRPRPLPHCCEAIRESSQSPTSRLTSSADGPPCCAICAAGSGAVLLERSALL